MGAETIMIVETVLHIIINRIPIMSTKIPKKECYGVPNSVKKLGMSKLKLF